MQWSLKTGFTVPMYLCLLPAEDDHIPRGNKKLGYQDVAFQKGGLSPSRSSPGIVGAIFNTCIDAEQNNFSFHSLSEMKNEFTNFS